VGVEKVELACIFRKEVSASPSGDSPSLALAAFGHQLAGFIKAISN